MENQFSSLDIQFIRSSLDTKTDGEIAAVLEVDIDVIHDFINELTGGKAKERSEAIAAYRRPLEEKKEKEEARKRERVISEAKAEKRRQDKIARANQEEKRRAQKQKYENARTFKTKPVDLSKMHAVRVDDRTIIFINPGEDEKQAKEAYLKREALKKRNQKIS